MKVAPEIPAGQNRLSAVNGEFLRYVENNPAALQASNFSLMELNDDLFKLQPWPTFINRKMKQEFAEAGVSLFRIIKQIPQRLYGRDPEKMSRYYGIPLEEVKYSLEGVNEDHLQHLAARGDFVLTPFGLKCLEYNVSLSLGGWQVPIWESLAVNTPVIAHFLKEYGVKAENENMFSLFLEHIVDSLPEKIRGDSGRIDIAFVVKGIDTGSRSRTGAYLNQLYKNLLRQKFNGVTGEVFVCDYPHLELAGDLLFYKKRRIHAVAEMYHGEISSEVFHAFKSGTIRLINGPVTRLLKNKLNLALLSENKDNPLFTPAERKIIDAYVPWSRKVEECSTTFRAETITDLYRFILDRREGLVIKAAVGYGGKGVFVGDKMSPEQWQETVETAFNKGSWVVQERVDSCPGMYQAGEQGCEPHDMAWGFFVFGSRYGGAWVRVMPQTANKGVINCHQGATVSVILEVER
jgi:hypothetical protein